MFPRMPDIRWPGILKFKISWFVQNVSSTIRINKHISYLSSLVLKAFTLTETMTWIESIPLDTKTFLQSASLGRLVNLECLNDLRLLRNNNNNIKITNDKFINVVKLVNFKSLMNSKIKWTNEHIFLWYLFSRRYLKLCWSLEANFRQYYLLYTRDTLD